MLSWLRVLSTLTHHVALVPYIVSDKHRVERRGNPKKTLRNAVGFRVRGSEFLSKGRRPKVFAKISSDSWKYGMQTCRGPSAVCQSESQLCPASSQADLRYFLDDFNAATEDAGRPSSSHICWTPLKNSIDFRLHVRLQQHFFTGMLAR